MTKTQIIFYIESNPFITIHKKGLHCHASYHACAYCHHQIRSVCANSDHLFYDNYIKIKHKVEDEILEEIETIQ